MIQLAATLLALQQALGPRLAAGEPLVVHAHVPLCDRAIRRRVAAAGAGRAYGRGDVEVYVVAWAWRGKAIDAALAAFLDDVYGGPERRVVLADGTPLPAAAVVSWVGHNRLMEVAAVAWDALARRAGDPPTSPSPVTPMPTWPSWPASGGCRCS